MTFAQIISEGFIVFLVGMTMVFAILLLLILLINVISFIINGPDKDKKARKEAEKEALQISKSAADETIVQSTLASQGAGSVEDPSEIAAVIAAALAIFMQAGYASGELQIRSIRRTGRLVPAWNTAGRDAYIATRL